MTLCEQAGQVVEKPPTKGKGAGGVTDTAKKGSDAMVSRIIALELWTVLVLTLTLQLASGKKPSAAAGAKSKTANKQVSSID